MNSLADGFSKKPVLHLEAQDNPLSAFKQEQKWTIPSRLASAPNAHHRFGTRIADRFAMELIQSRHPRLISPQINREPVELILRAIHSQIKPIGI
jgi:hypothetical protein